MVRYVHTTKELSYLTLKIILRFLLDAEKRSKRGIAQGLNIPKPKVFYLNEAATETGKYFFQTLSDLIL